MHPVFGRTFTELHHGTSAGLYIFESDGKFVDVAMTFSGEMNDGTPFSGEDTIGVRVK